VRFQCCDVLAEVHPADLGYPATTWKLACGCVGQLPAKLRFVQGPHARQNG
jgi:hypothetical protein